MEFDSKMVFVKDVIKRCHVEVDAPSSGLEHYVGGEHFETDCLSLKGKGNVDSSLGPAFYYSFKQGDTLLVSRNPHLRKMSVANFDGICSEKTFVMNTIDDNILHGRFIPIVFSCQKFWEYAELNKSGSVNFFLNWKKLEMYEFKLPSLDVQKDISHVIWSIEEYIQKLTVLLDDLELLIKSRFIEMFGTRESYSDKWEMKPFISCCDVLYGYPFNSDLFNEISEGMPLIRIRDINSGFSNTYTTENVDPIYEIHNGDVLVGMDGDFYAKKWMSGTALLNQRTCRMNGKSGIVNDAFMLHYLNPELLHIHRITSSTTVKHLSAKEINKMKIPLPPLTLQEKFAEFVEQVDKSKFELKQHINTTKLLQKTIINDIFK